MSQQPAVPLFDPLAILDALERRRVSYVLVGELARVIHGTDEIADRVEICPQDRPGNMERLRQVYEDLGAADVGSTLTDPTSVQTPYGALAVTVAPSGSTGFDDLRRKAGREPIGNGVRPLVTDPIDLARIANAAADRRERRAIAILQRAAERERSLNR